MTILASLDCATGRLRRWQRSGPGGKIECDYDAMIQPWKAGECGLDPEKMEEFRSRPWVFRAVSLGDGTQDETA